MNLFDCMVCQGSFPQHECEEVRIGFDRYYVCTGCGLADQEALEVERPTPPPPPPLPPIESPRLRSIFDAFRRRAA